MARQCAFCGKESVYKFCSPDCIQADLERYRNAWPKPEYRGRNWIKQRNAAHARDNGECQRCHKQPAEGQRKFAVHHIKPYRLFNGDWKQANKLDNLITLCPQCHIQVEWHNATMPKKAQNEHVRVKPKQTED